ncbi:sensor histidine kinase [Mesonia aquimarina]|uniref:sensor histidine kinase n=1 Tax=Mesonia aquimarina TaxID=1504967 RepID=UPI000EF633B2|nr:HAMP domain-containing sensor histidine kinase [Mesonia aquimarina]
MNIKHSLLNIFQDNPTCWQLILDQALYGYLISQKNSPENFYINPALQEHLKLLLTDFKSEEFSFEIKEPLEKSEAKSIKTEAYFFLNGKKIASKKAHFLSFSFQQEEFYIAVFSSEKITRANAYQKTYDVGLAEKLKISEKAFQNNFEYGATGMALVSLEGKWLKVNKRISLMLGYTKEELFKLTFQDITVPEDLEKDLSLLKRLLDGEIDHYQLEKRYYHKNGSIVYAILAVSIVKNNDGLNLYFISQLIDITEMKRAEKRIKKLFKKSKEQNERLENFAHIVSHNLRSHAGNFSMLLELYESQLDEEDEIITMLSSASSNLQETIEHLSEIVNMHNSIKNTMESIAVLPVAKKTIENLSSQIQQHNLKITLAVDASLKVKAVPAYLESIFLNFISNAIKYSSPSKASFLEVNAEVEDAFIRIDFKDNGLGIDLEKHGHKLFKMYKTFHEHEDARGIGLFLTKNQIQAMGGKIEVESAVDEGTTFSIYLKKTT